jgi:hypothetical protein
MRLVRVRHLSVLTSGVLLAASLTAGPAYAGGRAGISAGTVTAARMAVVGGTVTSVSGTAMPGVAVELYAWPSDAVLTAMKPGQLVPTTLLATTTTGSGGKYILKVPARKLMAASAGPGYANLEIFSTLGGFWFFPYQTGASAARRSAPVTVNLSSKAQISCGKDPQGQAYTFSGFFFQKPRAHTWAVVGQGYIVKSKKTKGDYVGFEYDQGTSHSQTSALGVGLSGYGVDAGYNSAGTHDSTATRSEGYSNQPGNAWFRTLFKVGQFRGMCLGPHGDSNIPHQKQHGKCPRKFTNDLGMVFYVHKCFWKLASTGWFGGTSTVVPSRAPRTPSKNCAPHEPNSSYDSDLGTAVQWSSGFDMGASLGVKDASLKASFNGSAQTGYDTNARMNFHFGRNGGNLCGTSGSEASAAILVARSK